MLFTLALGVALAQDNADVEMPRLNAQLYRHPIDSRVMMWTDDAGYRPDGYITGRVVMNYVNQPFVYEWDDTDERVALVGNAFAVNALAGATYSRVRFGIDVPLYLLAAGDLASGGGLGDIALDVKGTALDRADYPVGLAFGMRIIAPTATVDVPLRTGGFGYEIQAIADKQFDKLLLAANLGTRGIPRAEMNNVAIDDQLFVRLGGGYAVTDAYGVSIDVNGNFTYTSIGNAAGNPLEAMLGGWGRVDDDWVLRGGVSTGLTPGIGSPVARLVAAIAWEPPVASDTDLDGILDSSDACVNDPEDKDSWEDDDGCPEADNDADGIVDASDGCPDVPEDLDTWQDADGCPDTRTQVRVIITDIVTGKGVPGLAATLTGPEPQTGDDDFTVELAPGEYALAASLEGWKPLAETVTVVDGAPQEFRFTVQKDVVPGTVKLKVVDPNGKPIGAATWALNDQPAQAVSDGLAETQLPAGHYVVMVRAEGYVPSSFPIEAKEGEVSNYKVALQPAKVKVTREKLDIKDKIYFETGKATIKPESYGLLDEVAGILLDRPDILMMRIEGHTDVRGNDAFNQKLSDDRAASVRQYLMSKGVEEARLTSIGFGESRPIDPANNAAAWELNRRVEFFIEKWAE